MTPTELADALERMADHPDVTMLRAHGNTITSAAIALRRLGRVEEAARTALNDAEHLAPSDFAFVKHQTRGAFDALRAALRTT